MINTIKRSLIILASSLGLLLPMSVPILVHAQATSPDIQGSLCSGTNLTTDNTTCDPVTATGKINSIIATVINIFSIIVGVVAVIMIILGGLKYITSAGDSGNITGAKNTILYAVIGLVVVALAQFIVHYVLARATGAGTTP